MDIRGTCLAGIEFANVNLAGEKPKLAIEGWNIVPEEIPIL
jgi:hypothetical protein